MLIFHILVRHCRCIYCAACLLTEIPPLLYLSEGRFPGIHASASIIYRHTQTVANVCWLQATVAEQATPFCKRAVRQTRYLSTTVLDSRSPKKKEFKSWLCFVDITIIYLGQRWGIESCKALLSVFVNTSKILEIRRSISKLSHDHQAASRHPLCPGDRDEDILDDARICW